MTLEEIRAELKGWADDLALLEPQLGTTGDEPIEAAFKVARAKLLAACTVYAAIVPEMRDKLK